MSVPDCHSVVCLYCSVPVLYVCTAVYQCCMSVPDCHKFDKFVKNCNLHRNKTCQNPNAITPFLTLTVAGGTNTVLVNTVLI